MRKFLILAVTGIAVAGLTLAMPAESRADHRHRRGTSFSFGLGNGGFHFDYNRGYGGGYYGGDCGYGGQYGRSFYGPAYGGGYYNPRPVIVHPTHSHWTPWRGLHDHGHIHVPHRGHYHTYRY